MNLRVLLNETQTLQNKKSPNIRKHHHRCKLRKLGEFLILEIIYDVKSLEV